MAEDNNIQAFRVFNQDINKNILSNPDFAVVEASGNTRRSLLDDSNVIINSTRFQKRVVGYFESIDKGSGQIVKRSGGLYQGYYDWLEFRKYGFEWKDSKERKGMAIALMRKRIKLGGSAKFRGQVPKTKIFETGVNKAVPALLKNLISLRLIEIKGTIKQAYKTS